MTELNEFLQPEGAPVTRAQMFKSSMQFDSDTDRNTVTFSKIKNFSFNSGTGGTLTLGGQDAQSGQLIIRDANGNVIIVADQLGFDGYDGSGTSTAGTLGQNINYHLNEDGLSIYNGSITIYNNQGTTIIDNFGINSANNFDFGEISLAVAGTTSSTSYVSFPNGTVTIVNQRTRNLLIQLSAFLRNNNYTVDQSHTASLQIADGTDGIFSYNADAQVFTEIDSTGGTVNSIVYHTGNEAIVDAVVIQSSAGTHNYNLKYRANNGGSAVLFFPTLIITPFGQ